MLKLPKGLKKKKKDKKSKKNQELFTEEELKQFKREQKARQQAEDEEKQQQLEQQQQQHSSKVKSKTEDDEWSKFNQLTTGIDTVLKKTQGDLDRIKESSFFQRVTPRKPESTAKSSQNEQEAAATSAKESEPQLTEEELAEQQKLAQLKEAVVELSDSDEESEEADDIFDTNYIDEITSGNVPLAYVSESPDELELGPDPFDTGYADKIIKGPEVSKRGKKIVNIGAAVEVLTGRVEKVTSNTGALKKHRRGPQNLLLESFDRDQGDDEVSAESAATLVDEKPILSLLDDLTDDIVDAPIDLSTSLHLSFLKQKEEEEKEAEKQRQELLKLQEFEKDEFDDLAAESLTKKAEAVVVDHSKLVKAPVLDETNNWSEFENEAKQTLDDNDLDNLNDADPFDTAFVASVIRENSLDDDDFDPRAEEDKVEVKPIDAVEIQTTLKVVQKDLLSGSNTDLSDLSHIPVIKASESIEQEIDPFDTSAVSLIVQPKETEIKFLEKELLSDSTGFKHSISDPDFDPRSDEQVNVAIRLTAAERKSSLNLNIGTATQHKSVAFDVTGKLSANSDGDSKIHKPLTPYYTGQSIEDANEPSELSDSDFNPRAITPTNTAKPDLLGVSETHDIKVLTPAATTGERTDGDLAADPFDTSNVSDALLPGKAELKLIENELIDSAQERETAVLDINSDSQELGLGAKVLTPQITLPVEDSFDDADPFDTSFASNIAPGQAEIKLLESELIHK